MVRLKGFEPSRDTIPLPPQGSASANSAIAARKKRIGIRFNLPVQAVFSCNMQLSDQDQHIVRAIWDADLSLC